MTHNGQGDEPSARPAREGIVLPSDGGEPLLPGQTGDRAVPAGGQAWDQPWGPRPAPQAPQEPGQGGWSSGDEWGRADQGQDQGQGAPGAQGSGYGTPEAGPGASQGQDAQGSQISSWSASPRGTGGPGEQPPSWDGSAPDQGVPQQDMRGRSPQGRHGQGQQTQGRHGQNQHGQNQHVQGQGSGAPGGSGWDASGGQGTRYPEPSEQYGTQGSGGQWGAPQTPGGAIPGAPMDEGATQFLPPVAAAGPADEGATQFLPPVGPGALPPEMPAAGTAPAATSAESTRYLGRVPKDGPGPVSGGNGAGPLPPAVDPDAQPTQFMAPVPAQPGAPGYGVRPGGPEDRQQPPAEFDNLFRSDAGADAGGSTQQLPRFEQPRARQQGRRPGRQPGGASPEFGAPAGFGTPSGFGTPVGAGAPTAPDGPGGRGGRRAAADGDHGRGGRSSRSRVPLIAAVGVGIAVLGIGAGALLSGGGSDDKSAENTTVAATAPATEDSGAESVGPEEAQAVALDKLLADSGNSRDSVVKAVDNVRKCTNLGQAATDLRNAAKQRNDLVTRLSGLTVDKLENHAQLTAALNSAWKASASADKHYAAWADQAAGKKGCTKGQARSTGQTAAGNRESGTATLQKAKAAKLWNSIAHTYGLTERQPGQL
ncbi:hypothetical protein ACFYXC_29950 [Streptomyces sp. NPDC002701]|uniref:hypothetical protein n=1 Tax=Streptomyces sp. NPDC002701 TaxID=3364661 RepID=UPI0036777CFB